MYVRPTRILLIMYLASPDTNLQHLVVLFLQNAENLEVSLNIPAYLESRAKTAMTITVMTNPVRRFILINVCR